VQTGTTGPPPGGINGPVKVGHDFLENGSPGAPGATEAFDSMGELTVGHDLRMTNRWVTLGFTIGDFRPPVSVGHDLVVTNDRALNFGPSSLDVGNIAVGHDATFSGNSAVPGGYLEFNDNTIAHDATCAGNTPSIAGDPGDGPNDVGHKNAGCP
jgi:hypothetical protein